MQKKITTGIIWQQLLLFFFPILFGTFFQQLYNTADAMLVGKFVGKEALSAVGGTPSLLVTLIVGFFTGLSTGASVIIAQFFGSGDETAVSRTVHTSILMSFFAAVLLSVLGYFLAPDILTLCRVPEELFDSSLIYLRIYLSGLTGSLLYNMGAGILRAIGDSKRPFYFLIISCLSNIALDLFFILGLKGGIAGAAYATVISQVLSALLVLVTLFKTSDCYGLRFKKLKLHPYFLAKVLGIGFPSGIQAATFSLSNLLIQAAINDFGTDTVAAWSAYGKLDGIFWMTISSFGLAITTFVGQNYGAGLYDRVRKSIRQCLAMTTAASLLLCVLLFGGAGFLFSLFTGDANVIRIGVRMVHFLMPTYLLFVIIEIISSALRAMGDTLIPMLINCGGICLIRFLWVLFVLPSHHSLEVLELSYPISWIVTDLLLVYYYMRRKKTLLNLISPHGPAA